MANTPSRVCPLAKKCGGCQYQGMAYKKQLSLKQRQANMLLGKFGTVLPIIGMKDPLHYRNKVHAVFAFEKGNAKIHLDQAFRKNPVGARRGFHVLQKRYLVPGDSVHISFSHGGKRIIQDGKAIQLPDHRNPLDRAGE